MYSPSNPIFIENRPFAAKDIKVRKRTKDSTYLQTWESYWFSAKGLDIFGHVNKQAINSGIPMFCFWSKHCRTLQEAKQHIADCLNNGKQL